MRLANKTALITGGGSGIGLATARVFLAEGARVAITGRNKAKLDAAAATLGPDAVALQADVTDVESMEQALATIAEQFGKLDVVFANAGIVELSPLGGTSVETFEHVIRTNLTAVFFHRPDGSSAPPRRRLPSS
jgi:NAD(P)-dependent dehydrogenase (short-subunit alcohol dehydrogenase family)